MTAVMLLALGGMAEASVATKQIKVNYNNIVIYANGKAVSLSAGQEPFLLNGVTYVPLRVAGEALNSNVNWVADTKSIYITSGASTEENNLKIQMALKDQEIANLKKQVEDLKKNNDDKDDKDDDDLSDLEDDLMDDYDKLEDVYIDSIKLRGDEDHVKVEIEVDLDDYEDEWEDLTDRNIEDWLDDLVEYIQDELTDETVVDGTIYSTDDDELVEFDKDGKDRLEVDFNDDYFRGGSENASDVEDNLLNERFRVDDLKFTVSDISYDKDDDEVRVNFEPEDTDCATKWDDLNRRIIEDAVEDIGKDIANEFKDEDVKVETVRLYFYDEDNDLLDSYRYDV
ncbi:copper amine oxidase N-terminal domain-containing protein [Desulfoscipio gibsoniae]|uniref:Copper amine oxidase family protein n=1 Tax=Desulfoscipio gibsoniae DSM 7213 TaxID=767817 RepID=R4KPZ7_9FIRM|nr:copper amine oxidase N-terminal domain-containing protein [Desulfoscipio gibsoniae]AGL03602.1 copper amine oxidase family protein [Desulfoscipio gibsoniae DSM 7213]